MEAVAEIVKNEESEASEEIEEEEATGVVAHHQAINAISAAKQDIGKQTTYSSHNHMIIIWLGER